MTNNPDNSSKSPSQGSESYLDINLTWSEKRPLVTHCVEFENMEEVREVL